MKNGEIIDILNNIVEISEGDDNMMFELNDFF